MNAQKRFISVADAIYSANGRVEAIISEVVEKAVQDMSSDVYAMTFYPPLGTDAFQTRLSTAA